MNERNFTHLMPRIWVEKKTNLHWKHFYWVLRVFDVSFLCSKVRFIVKCSKRGSLQFKDFEISVELHSLGTSLWLSIVKHLPMAARKAHKAITGGNYAETCFVSFNGATGGGSSVASLIVCWRPQLDCSTCGWGWHELQSSSFLDERFPISRFIS